MLAIDAALLNRWTDDDYPPVEGWLDLNAPSSVQRYGRGKPLPPSELVHLHAVTKAQAGALLGGMSEDWIEKYVLPHVKTLKPSRSVLIPAAELQKWVQENADRAT
jgi:hypothetical protein